MEKETHILIATRGYLNHEVRVKKITLTSRDEEFVHDDYTDFGEYADYCLREEAAEFEQGFSSVLIIKDDQVPDLIKALSQII